EYREWKANCADEHIRLMRNTVKEYGDEKAYCAEIFGMFHAHRAKSSGIDLYNAKEHFDFLASPTFLSTHSASKGHYHQLSTPASSIRFMKSVNKEKQAIMLYGNNGGKWRYVIEPSLESKIWLWETVSVGGGIWNCLFNGQHPGATFDNRNSYLERDVYHYLADNEKILENQIPREEVGIYFSKASRDNLAEDDEDMDEYGVFIKGIENVLIDNHVQYGFCPDINFTLDEVSKYKLLIIPNGAYLSDEHIEIIKQYVSMGGGLIASYETSLYDEKGVRRKDFGLRDLFGCSYTGIKKDTQVDCYQMLKGPHTITSEFKNTSLLMNDGYTLLCTPIDKEDYKVVCTYVPKIQNQPPPKAWIRDMRTPFSTIMAGTYGKGKVVYFANQMDKLCYVNGHEDFMDIVYNSILWAKSGELSIETDAPDSVHIALTENKEDNKQAVLSLINLTSRPRRPIRQLLPAYDFYVDCRLEGDSLEHYKILRSDGDINVREIKREEGMLTVRIEIGRLDEFAGIYLHTK
ncbi:MAG TPA: beta-galactosidase trimerization domain-containing protein, partial [Clostridia bacterium]|nr:beta-galactosidase trimerization domain-containing protein [Clostridia bacterium]